MLLVKELQPLQQILKRLCIMQYQEALQCLSGYPSTKYKGEVKQDSLRRSQQVTLRLIRDTSSVPSLVLQAMVYESLAQTFLHGCSDSYGIWFVNYRCNDDSASQGLLRHPNHNGLLWHKFFLWHEFGTWVSIGVATGMTSIVAVGEVSFQMS